MIALWSVAYAASIVWVIGWVLRDLQRPTDTRGWRYVGLAATAFVVTWGFMAQMVWQDLARYPSFAAWLAESALFLRAYHEVTGTPAAWWWSSQLITWVVAAVCVFHRDGRRAGIAIAAYIWLGLAVAMSVALPLFLLRHAQAAPREPASGVFTWPLLACAVFALGTVFAVPSLGADTMLGLLVVSHVAFIAPGLRLPGADHRAVAYTPAVIGIATAASAVHLWATIDVVTAAGAATLPTLVDAVVALPAQSSITADLLLTVIVCAMLIQQRAGAGRALGFIASAFALSPAAAFILFELLPAERRATVLTADRSGPAPSPSSTP